RDLIDAKHAEHSRTLTKEVGKPIRQSKNELNGLTKRIDFFVAEAARVLRDEKVYVDEKQKLEERISHEPLGVVANISAWNYPYFVGSNVFVPALLAGNAVLYKPSEFATMTGRHIAETMHEAGLPVDGFIAVIGSKAVGDPMDETAYIGPITRPLQLDVLRHQVADAKRKGAKLLTGGEVIRRKGNWFQPTVFVDVDHRMALMRDESFGPIIGIQKVKDD